ncbi:unnamed protein product [Adineta ricciae]|uniref:DYW domain-containing protein n=1 Tax=Adineta ricciae TaxID=249248 RepID=A0A815VTC2_ADIRI|nr:unnamed protein product [Adineta ricciae]CAF1539229.1 unnamed protein product [Adineta ricciae]
MLNNICLSLVRYMLNMEKKHYRYVSNISSLSIKLNWNMKNLIDSQQYKEALNLFDKNQSIATNITHTLALKAATKLMNYQRGIYIHRQLSIQSLKDPFLLTSLIHFYMQCRRIDEAHKIFSSIENKTVFMYGAMLKGYMSNNMAEKVLELYEKMSIEANEVIITIVFNACAKLCNEHAIQIGNRAFNKLQKSFLRHRNLLSSAIDMLMKFGQVEDAELFFRQIQIFDSFFCGIMMNGYKINHQPFECLSMFEEAKQKNIQINLIMALALVGACAQIGMQQTSRRILHQISHLQNNLQLRNALIDMLGKSSDIQQAEKIFQSITQPDLFTYTSMINAYTRNGMGYEAFDIYEKIPNNLHDSVSHICILNACSHSGLIDQARTIFKKIPRKTDVIVTAMVDCLSRMELFDEAQELIDDYEVSNMPFLGMYMALLAGARNHRQIVRSEKVFKRMKNLFPEKKSALISASILLSNTYSSVGDYQSAEEERLKRIQQFGNNVKVGLSWTEVGDKIVRFKAHDRSHPQTNEIYAELDRLSNELKQHGFEFDSSWITRPIKDGESVESVLCGHSEKLAIAFNFIQQSQPSFIQITKNLRVCGDCHRATKMIAQIRQCEIIIRDANRIHHFHRNGLCSCQDHF